jgi:hypothetical protein
LGVVATVAIGDICVGKCGDGEFERGLMVVKVALVCLIVGDCNVADGWRLVLVLELIKELLRDVLHVL